MRGFAWYRDVTEALELAQKSDKLIWCFVKHPGDPYSARAAEGFEEPQVDVFLRDFFVPLRLEADEDHLAVRSLAALAAGNGAGGWPINAVLRPDGAPLFVTTYIPPRGDNSLTLFMARVKWLWLQERAKMDRAADELVHAVILSRTASPSSDFDVEELAAPFKEGPLKQDLYRLGAPLICALTAFGRPEGAEALQRAALGGALWDRLTLRWREGAFDAAFDRPLLGGSLEATAAALIALTAVGNRGLFARMAAQTLRGLESFFEGDLPRTSETPWDSARGYSRSLLTASGVRKLLGEQDGAAAARIFRLHRGWVDPVQTDHQLKASVPSPLLDDLMSQPDPAAFLRHRDELAARLGALIFPSTLSKGVSLGSVGWALYAALTAKEALGLERNGDLARLIRLMKEVDLFEWLPERWSESKNWRGRGGLEAYAALALALQSAGEPVFTLRADQLLHLARERFFDAEGLWRYRAPFEMPAYVWDGLLPSPLAAYLCALARSGDRALKVLAADLWERYRPFAQAAPLPCAGLWAAQVELSGAGQAF